VIYLSIIQKFVQTTTAVQGPDPTAEIADGEGYTGWDLLGRSRVLQGKPTGVATMARTWKYVAILPLVLVACSGDAVGPEPSDILERLWELPGVAAVEIEPHHGYPRAFQIDVTQPVDHANPGGEQFAQRVYLSHVDEALPMVFAPSGYAVGPTTGQELAGILQTNCLSVTHRYFDGAEPASMDWQHLTIRQAAADHHRIVSLFKQIYEDVWVSVGASKGGKTALIHRRFYPDDVAATVAYVAPILFSTEDTRFIGYLASIGDQACRDRIHGFQRMALEQRDSLVVRFASWFPLNGYDLTGDADEAFESAVRGYDWNFWQYHSDECGLIPDAAASYDEMLAHLDAVVRFSRMADEGQEYYRPYRYQTLTETGAPARNYDHLSDLLLYEPVSTAREYFESLGVELVFQPEPMLDLNHWLQIAGRNIIYIYGASDPWTGGAVELIGQADALKVLQADADHRVKIADLDDQLLVHAKLEQWLGLEISRFAELLTVLSEREPEFTLHVRF